VDYLNDPNGDGDTSDGIPDLFVSTGFSGWGDYEKWPWTVGYIPDYVSDGKIQAEYMNDNFADGKLGILYQNDAFGKDYLNSVKETFEGEIVSEQSYEASATDVSSQMLTIKDAGADVVFLGTTPGFAAKAIVAAHTNDYEPQFFQSYVNAHTTLASLIGGGTSPDQLAAGFAELEGTIATNYILSAVEDADDPAMVEHKRIMETFGGPSLSTLTVYGQSLAELVVEALSGACDNLNREGLMDAVESIQGFASSVIWPGIEINIGPEDHYAIQALQPVQIQADGTLEELGDVISLE
jgi:branched-chain amino acid transport system substrate-binding protein